VNSFSDRIKALFWGAFFKLSLINWTLFRLRFVLGIKEKTLKKASGIRAAAAYRQALQVPAYREFLEKNQCHPTQFSDLPVTSKYDYIQPYLKQQRESALYLNGTIPLKSKRDTSTGTTGKSTPWYRGQKEQSHVEKMSALAGKVALHNQPYTFVNGFAEGPWVTGISATLATCHDPNGAICVIGPVNKEIYACIKELIRIRPPGHPIVVGGYPPHIRAVVDMAVEEGFPLHEHTLIGLVGGEAMSEDLRDLIVCQKGRTGFKQCYSSYGASDLDINIGYESDFEIELRKLCHDLKHKELADELFGKNAFEPMIFRYDPLNYYIETDEEQNLLFTCVRLDRISPRIRYNLEDRGKIMAYSDVSAILKKRDIKMSQKSQTNWPFLFVWGRQGSQISFRGSKVAPENLGEAIRLLGIAAKIEHYGFYQYETKDGKTVTEILLEFHDDKDVVSADKRLLKDILGRMAEVNSDFVEAIDKCPDNEKPVLRIFRSGEGPMGMQQKKYPMRKQQYIFVAGDEFIPQQGKLQTLYEG